jgi:hypothetical protein
MSKENQTMSDELKTRVQASPWYYGAADMPAPEPVVASRQIFENEEGQKLLLQVSGPHAQVQAYLESMSFAFRAAPLEDPAALEEEISYLSAEQRPAAAGEPDPTAVNVYFEFLELAPPCRWEIYFDPSNVRIAGTAVPHNYKTNNANQVTATIGADSGSLEMRIGAQSVTVDGVNPTLSITAGLGQAAPFWIRVDGLDENNQYDLSVEGAWIT